MDKYSTKQYFDRMNDYFKATNYLTAAQLYLLDNPLLRRPLELIDIKKKIVGHWGTCPGQNFIYVHLNRIINKYKQKMIYISGPGHGGNFFISNAYLEGTYSEVYPKYSTDLKGLKRLCKEFSFPGGVSSHVAPEIPGSINEGGELGYSLAHGYGAVFDNPNLVATVVVGDGEAETGALATSWQSNKFINPKTDGAVLPILHLNGFKIANPTVLARINQSELIKYFEGCGYSPIIVKGDNPKTMHKKMAKALDICMERIKKIQYEARIKNSQERPVWPMIVLQTPKGWTGPKFVDRKEVEGTFRAHQVPITMDKRNHLYLLEKWLKSYEPEKLFDNEGKLRAELSKLAPVGEYRMSASPFANGGLLLKELKLPSIRKYEVKFKGHGVLKTQDMLELGKYVRDVFVLNENNKNFRLFSPDEAKSNRLYKTFDATKRSFNGKILKNDEDLAHDGRIMDSYLSEHMCEGWLEGYILTGRHGAFVSYEAFIRIVDSMISQHSKWLKLCQDIKWRKSISSLNLILSSNLWQQDHNGFTHQEPGLLDHLVGKKASVIRAYLPPDANCLISCFDHCLKKKNRINVVVASKHPSYQWLSMEDAVDHCKKGLGEWKWAGNCKRGEAPDLVMACCGDTPTIETLAAVKILKEQTTLKIKVVNVVDLLKLQKPIINKRGISDNQFDKLFTKDKHIFFNFHGYPTLIHELVYNRNNRNVHVSGYMEEGTITTAFDMRVINKIDRFNLVLNVLKYVKNINKKQKEALEKEMKNKLQEHKKYILQFGVDMPEIQNWNWNQ